MRVYSLPRTQLRIELLGIETGPSDRRVKAMLADPVTYIIAPDIPRGRPGRALPVTLAALSLWKQSRAKVAAVSSQS